MSFTLQISGIPVKPDPIGYLSSKLSCMWPVLQAKGYVFLNSQKENTIQI